jgi:hypothetical protein
MSTTKNNLPITVCKIYVYMPRMLKLVNFQRIAPLDNPPWLPRVQGFLILHRDLLDLNESYKKFRICYTNPTEMKLRLLSIIYSHLISVLQ